MNNGPEFFQTRMGHTFYESTMPRIADALERIASALHDQTISHTKIDAFFQPALDANQRLATEAQAIENDLEPIDDTIVEME